jgi:hypothetical protein
MNCRRCREIEMSDSHRILRVGFALALCMSLLACQISPLSPGRSWDAFVEEFVEAHLAAQPHLGAWAGRHEFDGRLPDWSAAGLRRETERLRAARQRALAFDTEALSASQRFECEHLIAIIDGELFWLEVVDEPRRSPAYYGWALEPDVYVSRPYAPLPDRLRAYIAYARSVPAAAAQIRANLRTPMPRTFVLRGRIMSGGLADFYEKEVPGIFVEVQDATLQAQFAAANAQAIRAMRELDAWFAGLERDATDRFALGEALFLRMLKDTERIDIALPALRRIAERDLARNLTALDHACTAVAPGQTRAACVAAVKADKGLGSPIEQARSQLTELESFLRRQPLVTVSFEERALVTETPAYARWNKARIRIPGPYEKGLPSQYQIAPPDPAWTAAEQQAYLPGQADLLFISVHEVWPGHFVQFMRARQSGSILGRLFESYAYGEGWAHYCEEMMWDAGLGAGDPRLHVGQLVNALQRNVRLVSAIGLHTGSMTLEQSEQLFREQGFQDPGNARQQAERGTLDPGYGNYTLGKLMIAKLRDDWTASRGGRGAWQSFHDRFLDHGSVPVPLVRRAMLGANAGPAL